MIKILFCGLKNDYGEPERGLSFEYVHFYETLTRMPEVEVQLFATDERLSAVGRDAMNQELLDGVKNKQPDLLFCFLYQEELKKETIEEITKQTKTKTFNWFADDHWRVFNYSRQWAPLFTLVSTTDSKAYEYYLAQGINNVIYSQWAANPALYFPKEPLGGGEKYDITFVGQNFGRRGKYIQELQTAGLPVVGYGGGFPSGRVSQDKMLEIFSNSQINLNFTEISKFKLQDLWKPLAKLILKKEDGQLKLDGLNIKNNVLEFLGTQRRMIKGRNFEVPACGGFLISGKVGDLHKFYEIGKEVVVFEDTADLIEKCRYYLEHEDERKKIAQAGYERTLREHTYEHRFAQIFEKLGLS